MGGGRVPPELDNRDRVSAARLRRASDPKPCRCHGGVQHVAAVACALHPHVVRLRRAYRVVVPCEVLRPGSEADAESVGRRPVVHPALGGQLLGPALSLRVQRRVPAQRSYSSCVSLGIVELEHLLLVHGGRAGKGGRAEHGQEHGGQQNQDNRSRERSREGEAGGTGQDRRLAGDGAFESHPAKSSRNRQADASSCLQAITPASLIPALTTWRTRLGKVAAWQRQTSG